MHKALRFSDSGRRNAATAWMCMLAVALAQMCTLVSCKRPQATASDAGAATEEIEESPVPRLDHIDAWTKGHPQEVLAAWYDVPSTSLAKRRAGLEEFTAANNRLPIGTLLEVTHLANGKTVRVRVTDRGIHDKRVKLDLCREAAEELGMVGKGLARVRMQVLEESSGGTPPETATVAAQP